MRALILARHGTHAEVGRVLSGRSGIALSTDGLAEATALAESLAGAPIASLHSSPRLRARETAAPFSARSGLEVRIAPALDEIDFGGFAGRSFAELDPDPAWQRWNAERASARCPGGETMAEAVERAAAYVAALPDAAFPALCVTHCDIIRGLVCRHLGLGYGRMFALGCDPASLTTLDLAGGGLVALNERVRL